MTTRYCLDGVNNNDLLAQLKDLVGASNQLTSVILAHLAEVEARSIYREVACSSLYAYCVYELRLSEDESQRRILAARAARRFPVLFEMLESAAIHLTGIVLLAPHLTDENHAELLDRARFRTKREIQKLIAEVAPQADVPAKIEPLGPQAPTRGRATWAAYVESLRGPVRSLPSGNGPGEAPIAPPALFPDAAAACSAPASDSLRLPHSSTTDSDESAPTSHLPAPARIAESDARSLETSSHSTSPLRYKIQFTADQRYIDLFEQVRNLLQHEIVDRDIAAVHQRAMEALIEKLQKRLGIAPKRRKPDANGEQASGANWTGNVGTRPSAHEPAIRPESRHIPAEVRRRVWERDGGQCTFIDERGERCRERAGLEFHHRDPFFRGGRACVDNIFLHCRNHNALEAERELGQGYVAQRIEERRSGRGTRVSR